jgi:hypothetical protein
MRFSRPYTDTRGTSNDAAVAATLAVARAGLWTLLSAHLVTVWGTSWDIRWHLLIGRDSFWIAPHIMTYSGVATIVLVSFAVFVWTGMRGLPSASVFGVLRHIGATGSRGYHLAALAIMLTVLAAPLDELWHRLFGLDVTIWSPPHLLGLLGGILNAAACWLIACEVYPEGSLPQLAALVLAGAIVYAGIGVGLQPAVRVAYLYGGVWFFMYPMLAAPIALVVTARVSGLGAAPALVILVVFLIAFSGAEISRVGFAWLQPESFLAEEIAKDPTSPIAVTHEIARKNGTTPGTFNPAFLVWTLLASLVMVAVDARRRPVLASVAYGLTLFVTLSIAFARLPAFTHALPSAPQVMVAALLTMLAGLAGGVLAGRATALIQHASPDGVGDPVRA